MILQEPLMGGEDFSRYGREGVPSFFFFLGTLPPDRVDGDEEGQGAADLAAFGPVLSDPGAVACAPAC